MLEVGTGFNGEMTGRENVYMNGAILGMTKSEIDAKMEDIIEFSEVRDFIDTPVKRYSSGMYVKLAFSVAAHLDSEIMIMDEVLAVGDMNFQQKCLDRMSEAAKGEGRTVLYVSHNMSTIRKLCTRCIVLDKGKIVFDGGVEQAISVYMNMSSFAPEVDIDLSEKRMKHLPYPPKAKMQRVVLQGKHIPTYQVNEPILFDLTVTSQKNVENLCVRFEIKTTELSPVGSSVIHDFARIAAGEERTFSFKMCAEGLTSGKYLVLLVMYEVNEFGTYDDLDAVMPAFGFEVIDTVRAVKVNWNSYHLGRINFRDIELLD
jgi:lipopolysaccharide transport system ATP-binding protein